MIEDEGPVQAIPKLFHNFITGEPFSECICCTKALLHGEDHYLIEKAVKKDDVIIEYAICIDCAQKKNEALSSDSRQRIEAWFTERIDLEQRAHELAETVGFNFEAWTERCIITGKARSEMDHYTIVGGFMGSNMVMGFGPYIMSPEAQGEMAELLSPETKREFDDFIGDNFGLPPELKKLIKDLDFITV